MEDCNGKTQYMTENTQSLLGDNFDIVKQGEKLYLLILKLKDKLKDNEMQDYLFLKKKYPEEIYTEQGSNRDEWRDYGDQEWG